jgi:hypothetical protein
MLVVDLMHEFELGVWKALFIHLLRMLNALDKALLDELDRQYVAFTVYTRVSEDSLCRQMEALDRSQHLDATPLGVFLVIYQN